MQGWAWIGRGCVGLVLGALGACGEPAELTASARYRAALSEPDLPTAVDLCQGLRDTEMAGECVVAVYGRYRDYSQCEVIPSTRWRSECELLNAVQLAASGAFGAALSHCGRNMYWEQCLDQVIGPFAEMHATDSVEALEAAWTPISGRAFGTIGDRKMWGFWHQARVSRGLPLVVDDCPREACVVGATRAVERGVQQVVLRQGCEAATPEWVVDVAVVSLYESERARRCGRTMGSGAG